MGSIGSGSSHKIAICWEGSSTRVVPGQCEIVAGDEVIFYNLLDGDLVTVTVPDEGLFGRTIMEKIQGGGRGRSAPLTVKEDAAGVYPYLVYNNGRREFAHASLPIIIVYPK